MSYYEPELLENLPGQDQVRYCRLISGLVLIQDRVCNASGWHVYSAVDGLQPLCGNEHCPFNCIDDEALQRQVQSFALPLLAQKRENYLWELTQTRVLRPEHQALGYSENDILYSMQCFSCGLETIDEQLLASGYSPLTSCPSCGSKEVRPAYWLPQPARTQSQAQTDFERFQSQAAQSSTHEEVASLDRMVEQLCIALKQDPEQVQDMLGSFVDSWQAASESRMGEIGTILARLAENPVYTEGSQILLQALKESAETDTKGNA